MLWNAILQYYTNNNKDMCKNTPCSRNMDNKIVTHLFLSYTFVAHNSGLKFSFKRVQLTILYITNKSPPPLPICTKQSLPDVKRSFLTTPAEDLSRI